jgi:hypothetical protein
MPCTGDEQNMPRTGDEYSLPAGTAAVSSTLANSAHVNSRFSDLEAEQNLVRPIAHGGTGGSSILTAQQALNLEPGVDIQAYDADLAAIAALGYTSGAYLIKKTAAGTWSLIALTAAGEAILDDADAAAQRTTLGLGIGTNVQAFDAALSSLAGLSLSAGDVLYATGADTLARLAAGADGQVIGYASGIPAALDVGRVQNVAFASIGTTPPYNYTTVPTWARKATIAFFDCGLSGTDNWRVQLGTGGSVVTTGYKGTSTANNFASGFDDTSGFVVASNGASRLQVGLMTLLHCGGNRWVQSHTFGDPTFDTTVSGGGHISLGGVLDRIRITRDGTNTFVSGSEVSFTFES